MDQKQVIEAITWTSSMTIRCAIVVSMAMMLLFAFLGLAAAGATLSDPTASVRVGLIFGGYILVIIATLLAMMWMPAQKWLWLLGGSLVATPLIAMAIGR